MSLSKLFNRTAPEGDSLLCIFQDLWASAGEKLRASLQNIAMDHRVDKELETEFAKFAVAPPPGLQSDELSEVLFAWIANYKADCKKRCQLPAFMTDANRSNCLIGTAASNGESVTLRPNWLVTLVKSSYFSMELGAELQTRFPGRADAEYRDVHAQFAMCQDQEDLFRGAFAAAWRKKIELSAQHPKWAADYDEFRRYGYPDRDSDHWEMLFGKAPGGNAYIVALCAYEANHAGDLYRPTIIDANANHLHYPSPPWVETGRGGLTVALGKCLDCQPLSEFVHPDVAYQPEHFVTFKLHEPNVEPIDWRLARTRHREKLQQNYPAQQQEFTVWEDLTERP